MKAGEGKLGRSRKPSEPRLKGRKKMRRRKFQNRLLRFAGLVVVMIFLLFSFVSDSARAGTPDRPWDELPCQHPNCEMYAGYFWCLDKDTPEVLCGQTLQGWGYFHLSKVGGSCVSYTCTDSDRCIWFWYAKWTDDCGTCCFGKDSGDCPVTLGPWLMPHAGY